MASCSLFYQNRCSRVQHEVPDGIIPPENYLFQGECLLITNKREKGLKITFELRVYGSGQANTNKKRVCGMKKNTILGDGAQMVGARMCTGSLLTRTEAITSERRRYSNRRLITIVSAGSVR
ncbi:hypothetical protein CBL_06115 [Carabus blaptoides fortunei]